MVSHRSEYARYSHLGDAIHYVPTVAPDTSYQIMCMHRYTTPSVSTLTL